MSRINYYKLSCAGGEISTGILRQIALDSITYGASHIKLGKRQEILIPYKNTETYKKLENRFTSYLSNDFFIKNNTVSAQSSYELVPSTSWINSETFKDLVYQLHGQTHLKINICDPKQRLIPISTGEINFIASEHENQWVCYIKKSELGLNHFISYLVPESQISNVVTSLSKFFQENKSIEIQKLENKIEPYTNRVKSNYDFIINQYNNSSETIYEGFHEFNGYFWLGIFNRNNEFSSEFIEELSFLCSKQNIGAIYLSCNHSLIVKYIKKDHLNSWKQLIQKHNVSLRHSNFNLNCQIDEDCDYSLDLKSSILEKLNRNDISLADIKYSISCNMDDFESSVYIKKGNSYLNLINKYSIYYKVNFLPLTQKMVLYKTNLFKWQIISALEQLNELYSIQNHSADYVNDNIPSINKEKILSDTKPSIQCKNCLTVYDDIYLNEEANIFPDEFKCYICEEGISRFPMLNVK